MKSRRRTAQHCLPRQLIEPAQRALSFRVQPPLPPRAARRPADAERMHSAKPGLAPCRRPRQPSRHAFDMTLRRGDDIAQRGAAKFEIFRIEHRRRCAGLVCRQRVVQEAQGALGLIYREERGFPCHPGIFAAAKMSGTQPRSNFHNRPRRAGTRLQHQPAPHQALGQPRQVQDLPALLRARPKAAKPHL